MIHKPLCLNFKVDCLNQEILFDYFFGNKIMCNSPQEILV